MPAPQIIDLATGCGNIAIVLASRRPGAELVATDVSAEALATARGNARRHGVEGRIRFLQGDLYEALSALPSPPQADMITANRAYEASVTAFDATKSMALKTLDIGK